MHPNTAICIKKGDLSLILVDYACGIRFKPDIFILLTKYNEGIGV